MRINEIALMVANMFRKMEITTEYWKYENRDTSEMNKIIYATRR